jgi:threonine/homoserine/homoserine lactone efflux protein
MPSTEHLLAFLAATLIFAIFPGPAILYAVAQTMTRGRRGGFLAALGLSVGGLAHVVAAAAGLSVIFAHSPTLFLIVKIAGAVYLVWMGIQMIRSKGAAGPMPVLSAKSLPRAFVESVVVELLNPKTALFFIAFLPQFVDGAAAFPVWLQFLLLGLFVNLCFFASDLMAIFLTDWIVARLKRSARAVRLLRIAGGSALVGLGAHMAVSRQ